MKFTLWHQKSLVISENRGSVNRSYYGEKEKESSFFISFNYFQCLSGKTHHIINSLTSRVRPIQQSPVWRMPVFVDGWSETKAHPWASLSQMPLPFVRTSDNNTAGIKINNLKCVEELHHSENLENNGRR